MERASLTCQAGSLLRLLVHLVRSRVTWSDLLTSVSSRAARIVQQSELAKDLQANARHMLVVVLRHHLGGPELGLRPEGDHGETPGDGRQPGGRD